MSITKTLLQVPGPNNALIAVVAMTDSGGLAQVTSIVQTGATWQRGVQGNSGDERVEIWWSTDAEGGDLSVLINTQADQFEVAMLVEYSGITAFQGNAVDQVASDSGNSATASSGTTPTTTNLDELAVAGFAARGGTNITTPTNGFSLIQVLLGGGGGNSVRGAMATLPLSALQTIDTDVTLSAGATDWGGVIATFFGNLLTIDSAASDVVPANGGYKITLTGKFDVERQYNVHIGPLGNADDPFGYFPSGQGDNIAPISQTELEVYSPELLTSSGDLVDIFVAEAGNPTQAAVLTKKLAIIDPDLKSLVFQMRTNFPARYRLGPRDTSVLPRVSQVKNLLLWSEDFSDVAWTKNNSSVVGAQADPLGGTLAFTLHEDATGAVRHNVAQALAITPGKTYTLDIYAKEDLRRWLALSLIPDVSPEVLAWFNLNNGQLGSVSPAGSVVSRVRAIGDGWHRCSITVTALAGDSTATLILGVADVDGGTTFAGLDQDSLSLAFAHFDAWSVERAYVMTGATPVT